MEIKIETSEELHRLLKALAREIVDANTYHRLYCDLIDAFPNYKPEINQSPTFWCLVIKAIRDARSTHLCRVYDQESKSLNLVNLLDTIKANLHLFSEEHFRARLSDNAFVDSIAEMHRMPKLSELEDDIQAVTCQNPSVKKLMIWRNNIVAHLGGRQVLGKTSIVADNPIEKEEIEELLDNSHKIFNKYSTLFDASTWSRQIVGNDDYRSLFKFIRLGLYKHREDIEKEMKVHQTGTGAPENEVDSCCWE